MAIQLYHACNGNSNAHVTEIFYEIYSIWQRSLFNVHLAKYYNMHIKKYVYINGPCMNQLELILPEVSCMVLGIENTGFPQIINNLERIREGVFYY